MVVRMDRFFIPDLAPQNFIGPVRNDLIGVHIGGGSGPRLKYVQYKLVVESSFDDLLGGQGNRFGKFLRQKSQLPVRRGGGFLEHPESPKEPSGKAQAADGEILYRPLRFGSPIGLFGDPHLPHRIRFDAVP